MCVKHGMKCTDASLQQACEGTGSAGVMEGLSVGVKPAGEHSLQDSNSANPALKPEVVQESLKEQFQC